MNSPDDQGITISNVCPVPGSVLPSVRLCFPAVDRAVRERKEAPFPIPSPGDLGCDLSPPRAHKTRPAFLSPVLEASDPELFGGGQSSFTASQQNQIELIAPVKYLFPVAVLEARGSVPTNRARRGLSGKRYYGGAASSWTWLRMHRHRPGQAAVRAWRQRSPTPPRANPKLHAQRPPRSRAVSRPRACTCRLRAPDPRAGYTVRQRFNRASHSRQHPGPADSTTMQPPPASLR